MDNHMSFERADASVSMIAAKQDENMQGVDSLPVIQRTEMRDQLQAPSDLQGAVVERVLPGSPADEAGLQRGDIITQVNRHDVHSASEVQDALKKVTQGQDALVLVWSGGGNTFRVLHAGEGM